MRTLTNLIGPLLLAAIAGCGGGERIPGFREAVQSARERYETERTEHLDTIAKARALWANRVQSCRAYHYDRVDPAAAGSEFVETTSVQIEDGAPTWRSYFKAAATFGMPDLLLAQWTERDAEIGAHEAGFPALTVDQLHDACEAIVRETAYPLIVNLSFDTDGVPKSCLVRAADCFDRCEHGLALSLFVCKVIDPPAVRGAALDGGTD